MLDAFIIERIRKEREAADSAMVPLRIEIPLPPPGEDDDPAPASDDAGVVIIDNRIRSWGD